MAKPIKVGIFGGSGYGGSELIRILLFHEQAEIVFVTANEFAGRPVSGVHRNLNGFTQMSFISGDQALPLTDTIDIAFLALPHGHAMELVPKLGSDLKVIDLSGDFRIKDTGVFKEYYGYDQSAPELLDSFVYGLTETDRDAIGKARRIANPGCFATAINLALAPIVSSGLVTGNFVVDAKTGSSGSGAKAAANTHHPQRMNSFYAYKPFTHQHLPEITQYLSDFGDAASSMVMMTHSLPVSRGIFASCYATTTNLVTNEDLANLYRKFYEDSFFVRVLESSPDINWVKNTNFCDIYACSSGNNVVIFSAIDNLLKGAAGQAVQNMNLMFGLDETEGLMLTGGNP